MEVCDCLVQISVAILRYKISNWKTTLLVMIEKSRNNLLVGNTSAMRSSSTKKDRETKYQSWVRITFNHAFISRRIVDHKRRMKLHVGAGRGSGDLNGSACDYFSFLDAQENLQSCQPFRAMLDNIC